MKMVRFSRDFSFRRIGKFRWVFGAAVALAVTGCGNSFTGPDPIELTVRLEGTVTASDTGGPIEGASVEVRTLSAQVVEVFTDSQGFYTLEYLYRFFPGQFDCPFIINYSAEGFGSGLDFPVCSEAVETIDVQLARN